MSSSANKKVEIPCVCETTRNVFMTANNKFIAFSGSTYLGKSDSRSDACKKVFEHMQKAGIVKCKRPVHVY